MDLPEKVIGRADVRREAKMAEEAQPGGQRAVELGSVDRGRADGCALDRASLEHQRGREMKAVAPFEAHARLHCDGILQTAIDAKLSRNRRTRRGAEARQIAALQIDVELRAFAVVNVTRRRLEIEARRGFDTRPEVG